MVWNHFSPATTGSFVFGELRFGPKLANALRSWGSLRESPPLLLQSSDSVIMPGINPHWLRLARTLKPELAIEVNRPPIRDEDVLMKALVTRHELVHQPRADAASLIFRQDEQMGIINHEMAVGKRVAKTDQSGSIPRGDERMRIGQGFAQRFRLFRSRPTRGPIKRDDICHLKVARGSEFD